MKELFQEVEIHMKHAVDHLHHELKHLRTGRASLQMLDGVHAEYYGTPTPLNQLANLSVADASMIVAQPYDPSQIAAIERAIIKADLGLNPSSDGKLIRIPVPQLTEERRKEIVKKAHDIAEHAGRALTWSANIEDLPEETNQVTLDATLRDGDGIPAPKVTYRISENSQKSLTFSLARMVEMQQAAGARHISQTPLWTEQPGHLLGTARMGNDRRKSVVDRFGRSHDVPNLFIVDGSVMVTSGAMNPTSTITALALRTAEHIADTARDLKVPA